MQKRRFAQKIKGDFLQMKIIAHFDSADSADFAAGALKNALSPLTSIETKDYYPSEGTRYLNTYAVFNTNSNFPTYSVPFSFTKNSVDYDSRGIDYAAPRHILEVVCRSEDAAKASRIIIGHGGRNISSL